MKLPRRGRLARIHIHRGSNVLIGAHDVRAIVFRARQRRAPANTMRYPYNAGGVPLPIR